VEFPGNNFGDPERAPGGRVISALFARGLTAALASPRLALTPEERSWLCFALAGKNARQD